jgi:hypothetical protein
MEFNINAGSVFDMELMESSFDLMQNHCFNYKRASWMMPTPFVLTDAVYQTNNKTNTKTVETPIVTFYSLKRKNNNCIDTVNNFIEICSSQFVLTQIAVLTFL